MEICSVFQLQKLVDLVIHLNHLLQSPDPIFFFEKWPHFSIFCLKFKLNFDRDPPKFHSHWLKTIALDYFGISNFGQTPNSLPWKMKLSIFLTQFMCFFIFQIFFVLLFLQSIIQWSVINNWFRSLKFDWKLERFKHNKKFIDVHFRDLLVFGLFPILLDEWPLPPQSHALSQIPSSFLIFKHNFFGTKIKELKLIFEFFVYLHEFGTKTSSRVQHSIGQAYFYVWQFDWQTCETWCCERRVKLKN